jgi:hypothetical protein
MEKCELARQEIDFLGHHITAEGASPILKHVQAIQDFSPPRDKKQLQSFLGLVNFYCRFIPAVANILLPLTDSLRADWDWVWAPAMQHIFQLIKDTLAAVKTLTHPNPELRRRSAWPSTPATPTSVQFSSSGSTAVTAAVGDRWPSSVRSLTLLS